MVGKLVVSSKATIDDSGDVVRLIRELPPAHCFFKVESYSRLRDNVLQSTEFTSAGYKWILHIYPQGNSAEGGDGYISIYVSMVGELKRGMFVNAVLRLSIYDQIRDNYLTAQYLREKRYSFTKISWGISKFLPVTSFNNASNGFLINDSCIFGAEVLVLDHTHIQTPLLSMTNCDEWYTWRIQKFSDLGAGLTYSPMFTFGDWSWKIGLYTEGHDEAVGKTLSACLALQNGDDLTKGSKLMVKYKFSVMHQSGSTYYTTSDGVTWLSSKSVRMPFLLLTSPAHKGIYLSNDVLALRVLIKEMFLVEDIEFSDEAV